MFWLKETSTTRGPRPCVPEGKDWAYGNWMYGAVGSLDETTLTTPLTTSLDPPTPIPETELSANAGPPLTSTNPSAAPPAVKACLIDPTLNSSLRRALGPRPHAICGPPLSPDGALRGYRVAPPDLARFRKSRPAPPHPSRVSAEGSAHRAQSRTAGSDAGERKVDG